MKNIKMLIASLCLATALTFSGPFVTNVYADTSDPQDNRPSGQPAPSVPPEVIRMLLILLGLL